jgi:hypothetical protein
MIYVTEVGQKGPEVGFDKQAAAMDYYFDELKNNAWEAGLFWYNQKDYQAYDANADNGWALIDSNDSRVLAWYEYQKKAKAMETTLQGDIDGDGMVGATDLNIVLTYWRKSYSPADFDKNGTVGAEDLNVVLSNWRRTN